MVAKLPPPLSLTPRFDKAKWHADADDFPKRLPRAAAGAHILAALRFLDGKGQLSANGKRALKDDDGAEAVLLAEHVRAGARAFLDEAYDTYLEASDYGKAPPVKLLEKAWTDYERRYDVTKRPLATPYVALLQKHTSDDPTLDALLGNVRHAPALLEQLREAREHVPLAHRPRIDTVLAVQDALKRGDVKLSSCKGPQIDLLEALQHLKHARVLDAAAHQVARSERSSRKLDEAITNVVASRERAEWRALPPRTRTRLRDAVHRVIASDPLSALCALRVAADASSVKLVEAAGTFSDEGTVETYGMRNGKMVVTRTARGWDDLRRAIARTAKAK